MSDAEAITSESELPDSNPPPADEKLSLGIVAGGLFAIAALIGLGVYLGSRASDEKIAATIAALPGSSTVTDDFEWPTPGALDGASPQGALWTGVGRPFEVGDGHAAVPDGAEGEFSLALVDTGFADLSVGATIDDAVAGAGLVFRFVDLSNYWALVAAPDFATWNLVSTIGGVQQSQGIGIADTKPGTQVSVAASGPLIRVFVNGRPALTVTDPTFQSATTVGLLAPVATGASFADFFAVEDPTGTGSG